MASGSLRGGFDSYFNDSERGVYLFDSATDGALRRFPLSDEVIHYLAFTSDGTKVAASLDGKNGVRIIDYRTGKVLLADRDYAERSRGLTFGPDDTLYAVAYDGYIRHYSRNYKRTHKVKTPGGQRPHSISVDPTGKRVAVGYEDTATVEIFDARTLQRIAVADNSGIEIGSLLAVSWSPDGKYLLGGGSYRRLVDGEWQYPIRIWDPDGRQVTEIAVADNTLLHMIPCGDSVYYAAAGPAYGRINPADGTMTTIGLPPIPDMRQKLEENFTFSADGSRLRFGLEVSASEPLLFDLTAGTLQDAPEPLADMATAKVTGLQITDWLHNTEPKLNDKPVPLATFEAAHSLAIRPDDSGFLLGADWSLRSFTADGTQRWRLDVPGTAWGVNLARDGELAAVAYGDGTIRWHRWSDGQELLTLFVHKEDKRWVAWTPTGYYMASPGAEEPDRLARQPRLGADRRLLPGLALPRTLQPARYRPAGAADARRGRGGQARQRGRQAQAGHQAAAQRAAAGAAHHQPGRGYAVLAQRGHDRLRAALAVRARRSTGSRCSSTAACSRSAAPIAAARPMKSKVTLPPQDVEVSLIAWSGGLASEPSRIKLKWAGAAKRR